MELTAIALARVAVLLEVQALDPTGRTSTPEALKGLGERYAFMKVPQSFAEFDFQKGIELSVGKLDDINIDKLTLFANGIVVDTRSSTDDSERVIQDLLNLVRETFGATIRPNRKWFASQVIFRSSMKLPSLHPVLQPIADRVATSVSRDLDQTIAFEPVSIAMGLDASQTKLNPGLFTIERRTEVPFSEDTYFSQAPLRTAEHIELIQHFEAALNG